MNIIRTNIIVLALLLLPVAGSFAATENGSINADKGQEQATGAGTEKSRGLDKKQVTMAKDEKSFLDALFGHPLVALFAIIALGLALGKVTVKGLSLGASGVLFVALLFGHMGFTIPPGVGTIGLVLFVFCVGITAGPSFFAAFAQKGADLAKLAIIAVFTGATTTYIVAKLLKIPVDIAAGLFAGALTSTPGLASAMDALKGDAGMVSIGYGIAYPFGVIGVVLFIQLMPKLLGIDLNDEVAKVSSEGKGADIIRTLVKVTNASLEGRLISEEAPFFDQMECCVSRIMENGKLTPVNKDSVFKRDELFLIVGKADKMTFVIEHIGEEDKQEVILDADNERMQIAVTSAELANRTLADIRPLRDHSVTVSRITRHEVTFIPMSSTTVQHGDLLTVVGSPTDLHAFAKLAGNKLKVLHSTDIISLAVGISLGVILGTIPIQLPGIKPFTLGISGGPLFVALVMGYFKKIGRLTTRIPTAAKMMLMELGLLFFLANAGIKAGGKIVSVLQQHGISLFFSGAVITIIPMAITYVIAAKVFKMNILESLGGICGGMTSTPALGSLSAKVDSEVPVTSYATAYPVALILMTIAAQILISLLR